MKSSLAPKSTWKTNKQTNKNGEPFLRKEGAKRGVVDCRIHPQSFQYARVKREFKIGRKTINLEKRKVKEKRCIKPIFYHSACTVMLVVYCSLLVALLLGKYTSEKNWAEEERSSPSCDHCCDQYCKLFWTNPKSVRVSNIIKVCFQNFKAAINASWLWNVQGQGNFEDTLGVGKGTRVQWSNSYV